MKKEDKIDADISRIAGVVREAIAWGWFRRRFRPRGGLGEFLVSLETMNNS